MMSLQVKHAKLSNLLTVALFSASTLFLSTAYAATDSSEKQDDNIEVTQQSVTQEELAAIYVLSEVCPKLIDKGQDFAKGYALLAKDFLPETKNPVAALKSMSLQAKFEPALLEAREDAKKAGDQANLAICQNVINYQSYK